MGLLGGCDQFVDLAEVDLADDFGFTIDALVEAGVVVGVAVDLLRGQAQHVQVMPYYKRPVNRRIVS